MRKLVKYIITTLTVAMVILICYGFYEKNTGDYTYGEKLIGIGVLGTTFVVMPLFIIYRYSKKGISNYIFPTQNNDSKNIGQE